MSGITRRAALLGAGAAALTAGVAGVALWDEHDLIRDTLHRMIGPFSIDDADMQAFSRDYAALGPLPRGLTADAVSAAQAAGLLPLAAKADDRLEAFQRGVLTAFVLGTDYLEIENPAHEPLHYIGSFRDRACANPFARFD